MTAQTLIRAISLHPALRPKVYYEYTQGILVPCLVEGGTIPSNGVDTDLVSYSTVRCQRRALHVRDVRWFGDGVTSIVVSLIGALRRVGLNHASFCIEITSKSGEITSRSGK